MTQAKKRELLIGCEMLFFSAIGFYFANRLPDSRVMGVGGTGIVPYITTLTMGVFSLLKCFSAFLGAHDNTTSVEKLHVPRCIAVFMLIACYALFLEIVGFILASVALLFFSFFLFGFRRFKIGVVYALGISLVVWVLFNEVFLGYLPPGNLFR